MDYFVGGVAALLAGNTTPNRPTVVKRALTPTKHQKSPNVTPKSELVLDRSVMLSPSVQKKKEVMKKSPKRIFQSLDADDGSDKEVFNAAKTDKVKKHLQDELNSSSEGKPGKRSSKSKANQTEVTPSKSKANLSNNPINQDSTPKKKKSKLDNSILEQASIQMEIEVQPTPSSTKSGKKKSKKNKNNSINNEVEPLLQSAEEILTEITENKPKKSKKKKNKALKQENVEILTESIEGNENKAVIGEETTEKPAQESETKKIKKKNKKNKNKKTYKTETLNNEEVEESVDDEVNINAITEKDTDSEHESDNEIDSETENKDILDTGEASASSDEEEEKKPSEKTPKPKKEKTKPPPKPESEESEEDVVRRTLFVGNVPFSKKCKKEIKKIFGKYGDIETVRIRTIPVKDGRVTPKMAVIKNELHPDRSTVNVYIKYKDVTSVDKALKENNTIYNNAHLRVTRSSETGCPDASLSIFVGNVPFSIEDDILRNVFDKCGEVDSVRIVRDKQTNAGKGFGYINFKSKDAVELALQMAEEDLTIKNRILRVKRCNYSTKGQKQTSHNKHTDRQGNKRGQNQNRFGQDGNMSNKFGQNQNRFGQNQNKFGQNQNRFGQNKNKFGQDSKEGGNKFDGEKSGAYRRIQKRRNEDETNGPPSKKPHHDINQPNKEKKPRKEFLGVTADKKKKRKFDKGQKKKKVLGEILTKNKTNT